MPPQLTGGALATVGYVEAGDVAYGQGGLLDDLKARFKGTTSSPQIGELASAFLSKRDRESMATLMSAVLGRPFPAEREELPATLLGKKKDDLPPWWAQWNQLLFVSWTSSVFTISEANVALKELWNAAIKDVLDRDVAAGRPRSIDDTQAQLVGLYIGWQA